MSIGSVKNMTGTTFANNTFFCPSGTYGFDLDSNAEEVRVSKPCLLSSPAKVRHLVRRSRVPRALVALQSRHRILCYSMV